MMPTDEEDAVPAMPPMTGEDVVSVIDDEVNSAAVEPSNDDELDDVTVGSVVVVVEGAMTEELLDDKLLLEVTVDVSDEVVGMRLLGVDAVTGTEAVVLLVLVSDDVMVAVLLEMEVDEVVVILSVVLAAEVVVLVALLEEVVLDEDERTTIVLVPLVPATTEVLVVLESALEELIELVEDAVLLDVLEPDELMLVVVGVTTTVLEMVDVEVELADVVLALRSPVVPQIEC